MTRSSRTSTSSSSTSPKTSEVDKNLLLSSLRLWREDFNRNLTSGRISVPTRKPVRDASGSLGPTGGGVGGRESKKKGKKKVFSYATAGRRAVYKEVKNKKSLSAGSEDGERRQNGPLVRIESLPIVSSIGTLRMAVLVRIVITCTFKCRRHQSSLYLTQFQD